MSSQKIVLRSQNVVLPSVTTLLLNLASMVWNARQFQVPGDTLARLQLSSRLQEISQSRRNLPKEQYRFSSQRHNSQSSGKNHQLLSARRSTGSIPYAADQQIDPLSGGLCEAPRDDRRRLVGDPAASRWFGRVLPQLGRLQGRIR